MRKPFNICVFCMFFFQFSCSSNEKDQYTDIPEANDLLLGGLATVFSISPEAYTYSPLDLTNQESDMHLQGDLAFDQTYVSQPAIHAGGLGPIFNQNSCVNCHIRNGRGNTPLFDGDPNSGLLLRISVPGFGTHFETVSVPNFGNQLQTKALYGVQPEGKIKVLYEQIVEKFDDGETVILQKPTFSIFDSYIPLPKNIQISPRLTPPVFGLGLVDAISEATILVNADEFDNNNDGISGRANYVWDVQNQIFKIGKFGLKASSFSLLHQTANAFQQDMGVTTTMFSNESCEAQSNCKQSWNDIPDLDDKTLEITMFYTKTLAVPARRDTKNVAIRSGKDLFEAIDCAKCHTPKQQTGASDIKSLSFQTIFPYSDFLLHDMGNQLADNRPDLLASGSEWKTPPLWGIGLAKVVNYRAQFLHDGRAKTILEAILWHGGEAEISKNKFKKLTSNEREDLLRFINSL